MKRRRLIYVGGAWAERKRVHCSIVNLHKLFGVDVTLDWTQMPEPPADDRLVAIEEREAVLTAEKLLVLWPESGRLVGGLIEIGIALAWDKPVIILDKYGSLGRSVFWGLDDVTLTTSEEAALNEVLR